MTESGASALAQLRDYAWFVRHAWDAARPLARRWLAAMVIGSLAAPAELWAFGQVADAVQSHWNGAAAATAWWWLAVAIACGALQRLLQYTFAASWRGQLRERAGTAIQSLIHDKASTVDLARFEHPDFYNVHQRVLTESETRAPDGIEHVGQVLQSLTGMVAVVTVAATVAWYLPLLVLLPFLPVLWVAIITGSTFWTALSDQTRERRLANYYASVLTQRQYAEEVRLFGLGPYLIDRWRENYWQTRDDLRLAGLRMGAREVFWSAFASLGVLALCGWFIVRSLDAISAGDATILVGAILTMPGTLLYVGRSLRKIGETSGYAHDLRTFLDLPNHAPRGTSRALPAKVRGHLAARDLTFTYPGSAAPVLDGIDLEILPGERVAIVGENGAGKTTLVKVLLGLYTPDRGTVTLDDADVHAVPPEERYRAFSAIFQQFVHYPWTLQDNVTLGQHTAHRFTEIVRRAGLEGVMADLPNGADTVLVPELGGTDLSGGQWQRVAIARAGWRDAAVLVLDEPTAALDPMAEVDVFRRFADLTAGTTTLFISHRLGMARLSDRVVVIESNRIAETGSHGDLRQRNGIYARMWAMQAKWYA